MYISPLCLHLRIGKKNERETKGFRTKIRGDPINQDPYSPPEKRREGQGDKGTVGYPPFRVCLCATVGSLLLYSFQSGSGDRATRPARRDGVGGEGDRDRGPPESLYYKQPRTCCNHLETMAHRSVRLAKRPGPHNSRDASSTTLRAIVGPLAPSRLLFSPHERIPSYRDGTRDVDYSTCLARGNADDWNRLFRRNACIKHSTTRIVSSNSYTNLWK